MNLFLDGEIFGYLYWHLTVLILVEMETMWDKIAKNCGHIGYILITFCLKKYGHTIIKNKTIAFIESRKQWNFKSQINEFCHFADYFMDLVLVGSKF